MATIPVTSVSLIRALADDPLSARWDELYRLYEQPMRGFLQANYPSLEPEDLIQETMVALARRLPDYRYLPDEKGHFRNYLMGILKHKAMDALARRTREEAKRAGYRSEPRPASEADDAWQTAALEVAIAQLLADETVNPVHRTVFQLVALRHEAPEAVAANLGISRANVDQIKRRLLEKLGARVRRLLRTE